MRITVIAAGRMKEKYLFEAVREYEKRLGRYCTLRLIEVADEKIPDQASEHVLDKIREKEAERIKKHLKEDASLITLEIEGRQFSSPEFAKQLEPLAMKGRGQLQFVIGASVGLHSSLTQKADLSLSFSKMTFPHQLMRVILLEQIYRGFRILRREPYHK